MNKEGHIIWSELVLILGMGSLLLFILREYGLAEILTGIVLSIIVFLLGVILPDWDHQKVQKKLVVIKWLKHITSHRGHWHSLIAVCVYGGILFLTMIPFNIEYWYWVVGAGMGGYFSHLAEDQIMKAIKKNNARNTLKVW